jgi:ATP-dependent RNA helicase DeaD
VEHAVVNVLRLFEMRGAMVFCSTREAVRHLHGSLLERGFAAVALSGELTQKERSHALQSLRDGHARVCVATDVAARGIDLPDLGLVIHADLPNDHETLLHRSGRTGRAGRKGICVILVPFTRRRKAERLLHDAGVSAAWGPPPAADEIRQRDQERLLQDPAFTEESVEEDLGLARALLAERSPEEIAAALVRFHRARLPAPEDVFQPEAERGERMRRDKRERQDRDRREDRGRRRPDEDHAREEDMVWFRMSVGRRNNADPRWLVPIICRLGHVTKKEIGPIRIFDRETTFGIAQSHAARFASAARKANDEDIRIVPAAPHRPGAHSAPPNGPARPPKGDRRSGPGKPPPQKPRHKKRKDRARAD